LPKLAGAELPAAIEPARRETVRRAIDESFVSAFRLVMMAAAAVTLAAAVAGALIR
jgi:hypothetical protein